MSRSASVYYKYAKIGMRMYISAMGMIHVFVCDMRV